MTERREPTISHLSESDKASSQAGKAQSRSSSGRAKPASAQSRPAPVSHRPVVVRSPLGPFALVIALIGLAIGGFLYWQLMLTTDTLNQTQKELKAATARVSNLEQRLSLSDDESTQSITVVQAKVKENASEIRKLWGVSYDTNRKTIDTLGKSFKKIQASIGSQTKQVKTALGNLDTELQILKDVSEGQQSVVARADQWMNQQKGAMDSVLKRVDTLDSLVNKRIKNNEEAIKAIDAFRVQVNRELITLKGG